MRRVLVVDDSKVVREVLEAFLEPCGFDIQQAGNGAIALQMLKSSPFDAVFVDIHMPVLDGPSLVRMMRAHGITAKVILITTGASTPIVASAVKFGVSEYVSKPFKPEQIRVVVARVLGLAPDALQVGPVRLLVQHPEPGVASRLRELLPAHVELDTAAAFARLLELLEGSRYAVVLLHERVLDGEIQVAAELVRESLPHCAIFALAESASVEDAWAPAGALDGTIPASLDATVVRDFLYPNFLRPLVFREGAIFHAAAFRGAQGDLRPYFAALSRALGGRGAQELPIQDLSIDLTRVPPHVEHVASMIREVRERLDQVGAAPAFRVAEPLRAQLTSRPELRRAVIFS